MKPVNILKETNIKLKKSQFRKKIWGLLASMKKDSVFFGKEFGISKIKALLTFILGLSQKLLPSNALILKVPSINSAL